NLFVRLIHQMQCEGFMLRIEMPAFNHNTEQRIREFGLRCGDQRYLGAIQGVSRRRLAGSWYCEREAHRSRNPLHVRAPICIANSCTSNAKRGNSPTNLKNIRAILNGQSGPTVAVGTTIADRPPQSGRTVARIGVRMMPPFPLSALSFRTAGFPQYGWKAGISDSAFPEHPSLKPAPSIRRCTPGLLLPFAHLIVRFGCPVLCRADDSSMRRLGVGSDSAPGALAPVRPLLSRSLSTQQPHPTHSLAHRDFADFATYTRCLRCAGAPRRPTSGSELLLRIPSRHAALYALGEIEIRFIQITDSDIGLRRVLSGSALPGILPSASSR